MCVLSLAVLLAQFTCICLHFVVEQDEVFPSCIASVGGATNAVVYGLHVLSNTIAEQPLSLQGEVG